MPCCTWRTNDAAILFTDQELETLRQSGMELPEFRPYRNSTTVFRVELKKSETMYACPFLGETDHMCRIYEMRPFDCRAWPFMFARDKSSGAIVIVCMREKWCRALQAASREEVAAYREYAADLLSSEEYLQLVRSHPALIWEDKVMEDIVVIRDVTSLLSDP